jgi:hypothetical protein
MVSLHGLYVEMAAVCVQLIARFSPHSVLARVFFVKESKVLPADHQYEAGVAYLGQFSGLSFGVNLGKYK